MSGLDEKGLAPCPFCGGSDIEIRATKIGDYFAICHSDYEGAMHCGASTDPSRCETPEGAVRRWNRRAPLSAVGQKAGTVEVRALEWQDHRGHTFPDTWTAKTPCGVYEIEERSASDSPAYVATGPLHVFISDRDSLEDAKAAAQADYEARIRSALIPAPSVAEAAEPVVWRCFHCDETFTKEWDAKAHFGRDEGCAPACQIKGAEGGLVAALRRAEQDAADAWDAIHNETTDTAKAYHAQAARHREQLIAIEQIGYDRGLRDGSVDLRQIEEMLEAGQGDDDGMQILPDFDEGMSTVAKVEDCLHLLEKRRDVISAYQQDREQ